MSIVLEHPDGKLEIEELASGKRKLKIIPHDESMYVSKYTWETVYPVDLIETILNIRGLAWVCEEITREEDPNYVTGGLTGDILSCVDAKVFENKTILDFGCGSGASTTVLGKLFPTATITGVELVSDVLAIGKARAKHYGLDNVSFQHSPNGETLPEGLSEFDFITMNAVFEHLLPNERPVVMPQLWSHLKPGGILFLRETPYRYSPIESHTTGLPFINYLPDKLTFRIAHRFSDFVQPGMDWEELLREGIRGGTEGEILNILRKTPHQPILLEPNQHGLKDRIDLWKSYKKGSRAKYIAAMMKAFKALTGITMVPYLSLAIQKAKQ